MWTSCDKSDGDLQKWSVSLLSLPEQQNKLPSFTEEKEYITYKSATGIGYVPLNSASWYQ